MEASVTIEEGQDDYVVIDMVQRHGEVTPSTSPTPSPCSSPAKDTKTDTSSLDSGYDEFVIVEEQPEEDTTTVSEIDLKPDP